MKVAVLFDRFGPYHIARLEAAAKYVEVIAIEVSGETKEYQWDKVESKVLRNRVTLFANRDSREIPSAELFKTLTQKLDTLKPDVVAVNGWYDRSALSALYWSLENNIPAVVMSESAAGDEKRTWWKEIIKKNIVKQFGAGLVGGSRHADYLKDLGMPPDRIFMGYDVVDNEYFRKTAEEARAEKQKWQQQMALPENFFLVVSRFIPKKNLAFIIRAYHDYYQQMPGKAWDLLILGDGPLKSELAQLTNDLGLTRQIRFDGFKQYQELPVYFGLAKTFVHASTVEQWGLVVNEAMAAGLPVVISERCGCVPELVHNGVNGFAINPADQPALTQIMVNLTNGTYNPEKMGEESRRIVDKLNTDLFGQGLNQAATIAVQKPVKRGSLVTKGLLKFLMSQQ